MAERIRVREREPSAGKVIPWRVGREHCKKFLTRGLTGKVVISPDEREWEQGPQAKNKRFIYEELFDDTALTDWWIFMQDIRVHSGSHRHQGGLVIYCIEGSGYSLVDGVKVPWEAGDLLLLPLKPGGVEHQHFNNNPNESCKWMAFIYLPFWDGLATNLEIMKTHPDWDGTGQPDPFGRAAP